MAANTTTASQDEQSEHLITASTSSLYSSASSSELNDDVPTFLDPFQHMQSSPSRRVSGADATNGNTSSTAHSIRSFSLPGTPTARRSSSSSNPFRRSRSSSSHGGHLGNDTTNNHSLFVEDLPEFQPYSIFGSSSPHRRRFRSSPTVSYILRRRNNANTPTPPLRTPARSLSGDSSNAYAALPDGFVQASDRLPPQRKKKNQRWKSLLFASAVLSIASAATAQTSLRKRDQQPDMVQVGSSGMGLDSAFSAQSNQAHSTYTNTTLSRRPSKLKKRPPKAAPNPALLTRRGSTYTEWRRSMVMEVSADVSRRSSQRSKRSTRSAAPSSSARTGASRHPRSKRELVQQKSGSRRSILQRCCRRLKAILRCSGRRQRRTM